MRLRSGVWALFSSHGKRRRRSGWRELSCEPLERRELLAAGGRTIVAEPGEVSRPVMPPTANSPEFIQPFLRKVGGGRIESGISTWVVIHGRGDTSESFQQFARVLNRAQKGDQVLLLDWREGAGDNASDVGLQGAGWIPNVAAWTAQALSSLGLAASQIHLAGHSWGSYLAYEIGARVPGGVESIVALDPARAAAGYDFTQVNFGAVSDVAWAFFGSGPFGSPELSGTADHAFALDYFSGDPGPLEQHSAPVHVFQSLLSRRTGWRDEFPLAEFEAPFSAPWALNQYSRGTAELLFEGVFDVATRPGGEWKRTLSSRYVSAAGSTEVVLTPRD